MENKAIVSIQLTEIAYERGYKDGCKRGTHIIATKEALPVQIPPEFNGHTHAELAYLRGQEKGYLYTIGDPVEVAAMEMDKFDDSDLDPQKLFDNSAPAVAAKPRAICAPKDDRGAERAINLIQLVVIVALIAGDFAALALWFWLVLKR